MQCRGLFLVLCLHHLFKNTQQKQFAKMEEKNYFFKEASSYIYSLVNITLIS